MVLRRVPGNKSDGFLSVREIALAPSVAGVRKQHVELKLRRREHATFDRPGDVALRAPHGEVFQGTR